MGGEADHIRSVPTGQTTVAVQHYLDALGGEGAPDPVVRELLARSVGRLEKLCSSLLRRSYPRLARGPASVETGDVLAGVVERLLKATQKVRPSNVRQFFGLANRHIRWELNELARQIDAHPACAELAEGHCVAPEVTDTGLTPPLRRMLTAIDSLPEEEREALDLLQVQGLGYQEAAGVVGVSVKTMQRRLNAALVLLAEGVGDLLPPPQDAPNP